MLLQIIFGVTMYPSVFILYFVLRSEGKAKNGHCFGTTMKPEQIADPEIQSLISRYQKTLKRYVIVMALLPIETFFLPYFSIVYTIWMLWLMAVIVVPFIPYVKASRAVKAYKAARGWEQEEREKVLVELKAAGVIRCVHLLPFLPPIVLSAGAAVCSLFLPGSGELSALVFTVIAFAVCTFLFYGVAVWMDRQKTEVISTDSEVNLNYARARKHIWKNMWLVLAWMNAFFTIVMAIWLARFDRAGAWLLWGAVGYTIFSLLPVVAALYAIGQVNVRYQALREVEDGSDAHWYLGGLIYSNKQDRHILVAKRYGIGTTFNMGHPVGFGITAFCAALLLLLVPGSCLLVLVEEFTPVALAVEQDMLVAEHWKVEYEIPLTEIVSVELVEEHPSWSKVNGSGMEHLAKGTFRIRNEGNVEVCMDPQNGEFLRLETADGTYWLSDADDEGTLAVYQALKAWQ